MDRSSSDALGARAGEGAEPSVPPDDPAGELAPGRRLALDVHQRLRAMILNGELPPGSVVPQAAMARELGVSRTPMREAFRLLQEEGLICARPDQRARVRAVDPEDLDDVYGTRIVLESLAVTVTAPTLTAEDLDRMADALRRMRELADTGGVDDWHAVHKEFHRIPTQAVGVHMERMLASLAEQSERYTRLAHLGGPVSCARADQEHEALLTALRAHDPAEAVRVLARHFARTGLSMLADLSPEYEPRSTRTGLAMVIGGGFPA
ncbi:GntR family transcriptional regulator [Streptomyces sp. NPDC004539]|uniref:GntR family transcriptional regulator n=1 Tax=Streptomyces sp. NPDC004539 TaxID=3154280 RepID=UPI0033B6BB54